jgi:hypothetical protein
MPSLGFDKINSKKVILAQTVDYNCLSKKGNLILKEAAMEDILNKILSDLGSLKEQLKDLSSTAYNNSELIKRNRDFLDRNYKQPLQNERIIKENRELIKGNKRLIEQNGKLLKQILTHLQRAGAKVGTGSRKSRGK